MTDLFFACDECKKRCRVNFAYDRYGFDSENLRCPFKMAITTSKFVNVNEVEVAYHPDIISDGYGGMQ